jgi:excisionase family DNA binding protein
MTASELANSRLPRLYTVAEVAEYLRVSQRTVRRMVKSGDLPAIRVGGSLRITESSLAKLAKS